MIRAILWKEAREHLLTFLVLGLGTASLLFVGSLLFSLDPGFSGSQQASVLGLLLGLLTAFTAILTGALLTGSDNEGKTSPWLQSLPGSALKRWGAQVSFALMLQAAMVFLWYGAWLILYWNHLEKTSDSMAPVLVLIFGTISCLAWGQWGGFHSKTVFGGFGMGLLGLVGALVAFALLSALVNACLAIYRYYFPTPTIPNQVEVLFPFLSLIFGIILPLGLVIRKLVRTDRQFGLLRLPAIQVIRRWSWLIGKNNTVLTFVLLGLGILSGFLLPHLFLAWPIWGLVCGVLGGLMILAPDQDGEKQFIGSMRSFSPLQFDLRVVISFVLSLCMLGTPMVVPMVTGISEWTMSPNEHRFQSQLIQMVWPGVATVFPLVVWLLLWWACGFGAGLWTSLFFDKWIVSFVVSLGLGALVSTLWLPSFFGGQLSFLWIVALVLAFWGLSRFLYRRFCAGTIHEKGLLAFGLLILLIGGFSSLAFLNRFIFLDGATPPFDIQEISKKLTNPNGKLVDDVKGHFPNTLDQFATFPEADQIFGNMDKPVKDWPEKHILFLTNDYPKIKAEFIEKWAVPKEVISLFVANKSNLVDFSSGYLEYDYYAVRLYRLRIMHGLWLAEKGAPEDFPGELDRALYLAACLQHKSHIYGQILGMGLENSVCDAVENYLLNGKPDDKTLKEIDRVLLDHDIRMATIDRMEKEIAYFLSIQTLTNPMIYASSLFGYRMFDSQKPNERFYWQIYNLAMKAPWEQERKRRMINSWFSEIKPENQNGINSNYDPMERTLEIPYWDLNPQYSFRNMPHLTPQNRIKQSKTLRDLTRVAIAAKRYQITKKEFPKSLKDLAPQFMAEIPRDSFTGSEFQMRMVQAPKPGDKKPVKPSDSDGAAGAGPIPGMGLGSPGGVDNPGPGGENDPLSLPRTNTIIQLKPGTLILWSIGPDGKDNRGVYDARGYQQLNNFHSSQADDLLFLVGP